ncbi:MAG: hypothetical protein KDD33_04675 [Bdellovibrionales bacterium]|nr:hypothetical protein [Bdellovibrionales bacterium]
MLSWAKSIFALFSIGISLLFFQNCAPQGDFVALSEHDSVAPTASENLSEDALLSEASVAKSHSEDNSSIFYIGDRRVGEDHHKYNACRQKDGEAFVAGTTLYSQEDEQKMAGQIFNVLDFGAYGDGEHHRFDGQPNPACGSHCHPRLARFMELFAGQLSLKRENYELKFSGDPSLVQRINFEKGINSDDEWDWIAIQTALFAAGLSGGGTVIIPNTGHDYLLSRSLWMYSNTKLVWEGAVSPQVQSYVKLIKPSYGVGTVISNLNPYDAQTYTGKYDDASTDIEFKRASRNFRCKIYLINPRVKAMVGENGLAFAKGAYDVRIVGGHVTGARWGTRQDFINGYNEQGGRALQFESGVQKTIVMGLRISDSTMGSSNSAGLYMASRSNNNRYLNAADDIYLKNIFMERVNLPFLFSHLGHSLDIHQIESQAPMRVRVADFVIKDMKDLDMDLEFPYSKLAKKDHAGVFNFLGGRHILITSSASSTNKISNSSSRRSLVKGFGHDIHINSIDIYGNYQNLVDLYLPLGRLYSSYSLSELYLKNLNFSGKINQIIEAPLASENNYRVQDIGFDNIHSRLSPDRIYSRPDVFDKLSSEVVILNSF